MKPNLWIAKSNVLETDTLIWETVEDVTEIVFTKWDITIFNIQFFYFNSLCATTKSLNKIKDLTSEVSIFPNPNNRTFNIYINSEKENDIKIEIFTVIGKLMTTTCI